MIEAAPTGTREPTTDLAGGYGPPGGPPGGMPPGGPPGGMPPGGGAPPGQPGGFGPPPQGYPPQGGPYQPPGYGMAPMMPQYGVMDPLLESESNKWMIINIIIAGTCCLPLGGLGAYFAYDAQQKAKMGMIEQAQSKLGTAKTMGFIGAGISVVVILLYVVLVAVAGAGSTY